MSEIDAVGHRVVHGGEFFSDSVIITEKVLKAIEDCVPLAPLHNPPNLIGIQACREVMGPVRYPGGAAGSSRHRYRGQKRERAGTDLRRA